VSPMTRYFSMGAITGPPGDGWVKLLVKRQKRAGILATVSGRDCEFPGRPVLMLDVLEKARAGSDNHAVKLDAGRTALPIGPAIRILRRAYRSAPQERRASHLRVIRDQDQVSASRGPPWNARPRWPR
jgi:hypothetical protein